MTSNQNKTTSTLSMSRRTFLQGMLALPLVAAASAITPLEAEAASSYKVCRSYMQIRAPKIWKRKLHISPQGHVGGNYHVDVDYVTDPEWYSRVAVFRVDGVIGRSAARGETKVSSGKIRKGCVYWTMKRGKTKASATAFNIPLTVWESAHGQGYYDLSEAQGRELLEISTGGAIKYDTLVTWSKSKAKQAGAKAVKRWVGKKVVRNCKLL